MKNFKVIIGVMLVLVMLVLSGCSSADTSSDNSNGDTTNTPSNPSDEGATEQVLFENDKAKVTFIEIYEVEGLSGNCYLRLKVENKSDKTVMVALKDSYVNDTAQMMGTGVPIVLAPGKNSQQPFFFGYGNLGITSKDEIQKIEFKVWLIDDDNNDTVVETESLVVEFNK